MQSLDLLPSNHSIALLWLVKLSGCSIKLALFLRRFNAFLVTGVNVIRAGAVAEKLTPVLGLNETLERS